MFDLCFRVRWSGWWDDEYEEWLQRYKSDSKTSSMLLPNKFALAFKHKVLFYFNLLFHLQFSVAQDVFLVMKNREKKRNFIKRKTEGAANFCSSSINHGETSRDGCKIIGEPRRYKMRDATFRDVLMICFLLKFRPQQFGLKAPQLLTPHRLRTH